MRLTKTATLRLAVASDCTDLASRLRDEDISEIEALTDLPPEECFLRGLQHSPSVVCINGRAEMIFYCQPSPPVPNAGFFGLASSADVLRDEALIRALLRGSRRVVSAWHRRFPMLWTLTSADNYFHQRWLRFLGFDFIEKNEANGLAFYTAARRQAHDAAA